MKEEDGCICDDDDDDAFLLGLFINGNFYLFFRVAESLPILLYIHNLHERTMGRGEDLGCVCPGVQSTSCGRICKCGSHSSFSAVAFKFSVDGKGALCAAVYGRENASGGMEKDVKFFKEMRFGAL